jgi:hypothetical protein
VIPEQLNDRAADSWEPLQAIADLAGPAWSERAGVAAIELLAKADARYDESIGISVLAHIRHVFEHKSADRISTTQLVEALASDPEGTWTDRGVGAHAAAQRLARLLRPYGIFPRTIRLTDGTTPKGYHRESFYDAFARYLPPAATPPQAADQAE